VRLGGYLTNLIQFPVTYKRANNAEHLADLKREAMSMAVLARLHIAYQQYLASSREFRRAQQVADVDRRLYDQIRNRTANDIGGDLERISAQVSSVIAQLQRYQSYAETQAALGRIYSALGVDPMPDRMDVLDLEGVNLVIRKAEADKASTPATDVARTESAPDARLAVDLPAGPATPAIDGSMAQAAAASSRTADANAKATASDLHEAAPAQ
jgi:hypothetical protein